MSRTLRLGMIVAATALVSALTLTRAQTHPASDAQTQPASAPVGAAFGASEKDIEKAAAATTSPTTRAVIAPEAKDLVDKITKAYTDLKSLALTATISSDFNVDGQKSNESAEFHASFAAPNKFRHEVKDDGYVGSDGEKVYAYTKEKNVYMTADAPKQKVMLADLPDPVAFPLASEDLSLVLAISPDPLAELSAVYPKIDKAADVTIDGKPHPALKLTDKQNRSPLTVALDPSTHLIRRVVADVTGEVLARGAAKVDRAQVTVDYTSTKANDATQPEQFAFAAPSGAKDANQIASRGMSPTDTPASALVGKPAPAFKLETLDGKKVALADLKGSVVVLDFWATWCPPCIEGLPVLDKMSHEREPEGVKVFAINQAEEKPQVEEFVKAKSLTVPVLLDPDGRVGDNYHADPIPLTVVIDKAGTVKKAIAGIGDEAEKQVKQAIDDALKGQ